MCMALFKTGAELRTTRVTVDRGISFDVAQGKGGGCKLDTWLIRETALDCQILICEKRM